MASEESAKSELVTRVKNDSMLALCKAAYGWEVESENCVGKIQVQLTSTRHESEEEKKRDLHEHHLAPHTI